MKELFSSFQKENKLKYYDDASSSFKTIDFTLVEKKENIIVGEGKTEYEYHEKVIVRNMKREILERLEGGIQEIRPEEYYILQ